MADTDISLDGKKIERLLAAVGKSSATAYVKDGELRYGAASSAHAQAVGAEPASLVGHLEPNPATNSGGQARDEAERRCIVFGRPQRIRVKQPDGEAITLVLTRLRRREDDAIFLFAHETGISLSDLLEGKEGAELPQPKSDLESIIEAMPMGVVVTDADLKVELVNGPFFEIWKLVKREELIGSHFRALIDINRHNNIYDVDDAEWETYVAVRLEEIARGAVEPRKFERADGVVLMFSVVELSGGRRMICYYDVTELEERRRQADRAKSELERTVSLLDDAAETMAQGLMIYDDENIVFVNDRFYEFLEVPRDRFAPGLPWWSFIEYCAERGDYGTPEQAAKTCAYIRESAGRGEIHQLERCSPSGRWMRIDGKPTASGLTVITYSDISELKAREAELEALVVKAEASDRAKSEFLANMSHEIRTPMNGVLGMAELLAKTELDTRQRTYCDVVVKSGNALLKIINDILDFSKIEAGAISLDAQPFDLRSAVEDVAGLMAANAAEKDIEIAVDIARELPACVIGDEGRFRQVLTNLVGNAVKFTEKGHVLIALSGEVAAGSLHLSLRVEDSGLGIPEEKLQSIFDKFSQVDGSSTRRHEGTGLGLAITIRLIDLMGGRIEVESEEGVGSVFMLSLDLPVEEGVGRTSAPVTTNIAEARILVVDDNQVNRDILTTQLIEHGCDVCAAVDGREGLAFLHAAVQAGIAVDCVVLDHHMPGMTGLAMAAEMRAVPALADIPILLLTSVDADPNSPEIAKLRLSGWLTKPAREAVLVEMLAGIVGIRRDNRLAAPIASVVLSSVEDVSEQPASDAEDNADVSLDLWMDDEGLAESVAGIAAVLSSDGGEEDWAHHDRQLDSRPQSAGRAVSAGASRLDILVAEDNEVNQIVFSQILDDLAVVYRIVGNGALAVEACQQDRPSLVLMDVSMPIMNGHQATRAIREAEAGNGHVPIIGITAHALKGDREACLEAGMDDYMTKPVSPEALEKKIRQWIDIGGEVLRQAK